MHEKSRASAGCAQNSITQSSRVTGTQAFIIVSFPALGILLRIATGMPAFDVIQFLAECGGIGVAAAFAAPSGRRSAMDLLRRALAAEETQQ